MHWFLLEHCSNLVNALLTVRTIFFCGAYLVNTSLTVSNTTFFNFGRRLVDFVLRFLCGRAVMSAQEEWRSGSVSPTLSDAECESPVAEVLSIRADSRVAQALPAVVSVADVALVVHGTWPENIVFELLQNLMCTGFLNSAAETRLKNVCASIDTAESAALSNYIDDRWQSQWSSLPEFLRSDIPGRQTEMKTHESSHGV